MEFDINESNLAKIKEKLEKIIIKLNKEYDGSRKRYEELEKIYSRFHCVCDKLTEQTGVFQGRYASYFNKISPCIFVVDAKPKNFELDEEILERVSIPKEVYTLEEAETLLKWTVNNTRNNLRLDGDKEDLTGSCGLAQFSSLYPLQRLGLKITINNASLFGGGSHAFGTVIIPVEIDGEVVEKQYLIDCTYSQFYILYNCVEGMYNDINGRVPDAGYYIRDDISKKEFVSEVITNGYFEFNLDNMRKYALGLCMNVTPRDKQSELVDNFEKIDFVNIINNVQSKFDYDEEEFLGWGLNLEIDKKRGHYR